MRPLPENAPAEWKRFYDSHARTRVAIECAFGRWKNKFLCLKRELRFTDPRICSSIILACAYLHNFILETNEEEQSVMNEALQLTQQYQSQHSEATLLEENEPLSQNPRERRRRGMELLNDHSQHIDKVPDGWVCARKCTLEPPMRRFSVVICFVPVIQRP
uniref:DDE Tnp4 domain-containing protein n=1 Tax=Globodera rostochiensis TaxID=31243 RepID=A0A914GPV8_GLORO